MSSQPISTEYTEQTNMQNFEAIIDEAFAQITTLSPQNANPIYKQAVTAVMQQLEAGAIRVAEKIAGHWTIHGWIKKAILLYFRLHENTVITAGDFTFFDKVGIRFSNFGLEEFKQQQVRVVPPAIARTGTYIAPNCVLMPSYINIGAYIDTGTMIDIWATVGSCAQIGKNVHVSSNVCIGGVLEPLQANPVIIEDNCFIGTGAAIVEGVIVEENSIIGMGVKIGSSTKIYDRQKDTVITNRVPTGSVVVPGSIPSKDGKYNLDCAVIVKTVDSNTRAKVSVNQLLREVINE